jgi:hypothetical protein
LAGPLYSSWIQFQISLNDVQGEDVQGEDVQGEDVQGEDVQGEDVQGEDVQGEDVQGEIKKRHAGGSFVRHSSEMAAVDTAVGRTKPN